MALKYTLDTLEGTEETLHSLYKEDNGKFILDVEGVKPVSDVEKLQKAIEAERKVTKQFKDQYTNWESKFAGKTPDEIVAQLERIPVLEAESTGKVDQAKLNSIVETTVKSRTAPFELELNKRQQAIAERDQIIEQYKAADRRRTIHDSVREVAAKEGFQESSYSGAEGALMLLAERHLTINSIGQVVVADDSKSYTPGLAVREALGEIKTQHPYLLKQSVGGGATGSNGVTTNQNPFKQNNMTERSAFMKANPGKWEHMMKQAGLSNPSQTYEKK